MKDESGWESRLNVEWITSSELGVYMWERGSVDLHVAAIITLLPY